MPNLVSAMGAVTSPKFARFQDSSANRNYLLKSSVFFLATAVVCGLLLLPLGYLFMFFSGPQYLAGFIPFLILILSQVIFLAFSPLRDSLLYYHSRPDYFFWISLCHGFVTLVSGFILLPYFDLIGQMLLNLMSLGFYLRLTRAN
jgi:O-antigen/teichoic acid export membrane protein